ncbi:MAG: FtsQ-type POTRA domain-containing protein [Syntrophobacteraceae bacterium]|nr:FtsQ-type POTRA domain-containing protein [Syntrophobacteraceae bacterium]
MIKPRKLKRNKYQESVRDRLKGNFRPLCDLFALFAWFFFVLTLGAGLSQLYYQIVSARWLKLERIDITGMKMLNRTEVLDAMGLKRGECALDIDSRRVEGRLARLPVVDSASVRLDWKGRLAAAIVERKPVAVVQCGGRNMLMDSKGVLFAETSPGQKNPLPLITGLCDSTVKTGDSVSEGSLRYISELLSAVSGSKSWLSSSSIDECRWTRDGFTVILGQRAIPVNFGKEDFERKLAKLRDVIITLNDRGWTDLVTRIDLDYPGRAYLEGQFPGAAPVQGTAKRPG